MIWIGSGNCDYHCLADGVCEVTYFGRDVSRYESIKVISNSVLYFFSNASCSTPYACQSMGGTTTGSFELAWLRGLRSC